MGNTTGPEHLDETENFNATCSDDLLDMVLDVPTIDIGDIGTPVCDETANFYTPATIESPIFLSRDVEMFDSIKCEVENSSVIEDRDTPEHLLTGDYLTALSDDLLFLLLEKYVFMDIPLLKRVSLKFHNILGVKVPNVYYEKLPTISFGHYHTLKSKTRNGLVYLDVVKIGNSSLKLEEIRTEAGCGCFIFKHKYVLYQLPCCKDIVDDVQGFLLKLGALAKNVSNPI